MSCKLDSDKQGVLFIDAPDASRGGSSEPVFHELIRDVIEEAPNWHVSRPFASSI